MPDQRAKLHTIRYDMISRNGQTDMFDRAIIAYYRQIPTRIERSSLTQLVPTFARKGRNAEWIVCLQRSGILNVFGVK